mgnify:CR=1 FL=1
MSLVNITVDNTNYKAEDKTLLIDFLIHNNIEIPYFCYHEALGADGNCRMCMVEIEGQKRPQIACDTFIKDGMIVKTKGEKINSVRQRILELELVNHPVDCPICDQAGECKLQDFYMNYGLHDSKVEQKQKVHHKKHVDLGSQVMLDQERCVLCARCVRFTSNVTRTGELGIINRGDHACVSVVPGMKLDNPYAMNVVDLCPVGALTSKDFRFNQRVWFLKSVNSVCPGCATGCNIFIDHSKEKYKDDMIYRFRPRINNDVNGHFMCDAGRLSYHSFQENRLEKIILNSSAISAASALEVVKTKLKSATNVAILVDANLFSEDIAAIASFATAINAHIACPQESYFDDNFGDDWLKNSQRCANLWMIKDLQINDQFELSEIDLLINFNHPDFSKYSPKQSISFQTHKNFDSALMIPIPAFFETSGTFVNKDGIKQHCEKATSKLKPLATIGWWITQIRNLK